MMSSSTPEMSIVDLVQIKDNAIPMDSIGKDTGKKCGNRNNRKRNFEGNSTIVGTKKNEDGNMTTEDTSGGSEDS